MLIKLLGKSNQNNSKNTKKKVRFFVNKSPSEIKHMDYNISQNSPQTGGLTLFSNVSQGTDVVQRVGNKLYLVSINVRMRIKLHPSSTSPTSVRLILVLDKQGYNSPVASDILENSTLGTGLATMSQYNSYYQNRFSILMDSVLTVDDDDRVKMVNKTIQLHKTSFYIGSGTTFSNQVWLLHLSDESNALHLPYVEGSNRLYFTDD